MKKIAVILSFVLLSACSEPPEAPTAPVSVNPQHEIATQWVTAATTSKTAMMDMIKTHMAESGVIHRNRYVGFGFQFDPDRSDGMVVQRVIPGSPAEGVLQVGDRFLSVRDIEVSEATIDQLDFRGKPGELVEATIQRGDETLTVAIQRGIVSAPSSKTEFLSNMASANEEDWAPDTFDVRLVNGTDNQVFVWTELSDTDDVNGLPYTVYQLAHFEFNSGNQVIGIRSFGEQRFRLEQTGFKISR